MEFQPAKELGGLKRETAPQFSASVDLWPFVEKSQKNGKKRKNRISYKNLIRIYANMFIRKKKKHIFLMFTSISEIKEDVIS